MSPGSWLPSVRLDAHGMHRLLGALEAEIMQALWERADRSAPEVHQALGRRVALNTVVTVLNRLTDKGLLRRSGTRRSYRYQPAHTRAEFVTSVTRELVEGMVRDFGDVAADCGRTARVDLHGRRSPVPSAGLHRHPADVGTALPQGHLRSLDPERIDGSAI